MEPFPSKYVAQRLCISDLGLHFFFSTEADAKVAYEGLTANGADFYILAGLELIDTRLKLKASSEYLNLESNN
jgi:hypothetical protein